MGRRWRHWQKPKSATVKLTGNIGDGINGAQWADVDGQRAVFKGADTETADVHPGIAAGSYYQREAAVAELDRLLGDGAVVPETHVREVAGRVGSLQTAAPGTQAWDLMTDAELAGQHEAMADAPDTRRMFLLDAITGNGDRHGGNSLWEKTETGYNVAAIDNGLTFPDGVTAHQFLFPVPTQGARFMALDAQSVNQVAGLDLATVAGTIGKYEGITEHQITETLARVRQLQLDPGVLGKLAGAYKDPNKAMLRWVNTPSFRRNLPAEDLARIKGLAKK